MVDGNKGRASLLGALAGLVVVALAGCGSTASRQAPAPAATIPLLAVVSPAQEGPCLVNTQYQHGAKVILRIQVLDPATGRQMTDKNLSGVDVVLPNGTRLAAHFGPHENGKIPFWTAHWTIPAGYPTGRVNYTLAVKGSSRKVEQVQFDVGDPAAYLTVLQGTAKDTAG